MNAARSLLMTCIIFIAQCTHTSQVTTTLPINKVILWGHKLHSHTHSYIHWAFHRTFTHLGYDTYWFDNNDDVSDFDFSNALFITEGQVDQKMPVRNDCFYILHNCGRAEYKNLYAQGHAITLQVYTHDCLRYNLTKLDDCIYYDVKSASIYMPWATDLLPDEIDENKKNMRPEKRQEIVFIGTVGCGEFGNIEHIGPFKKAGKENNINFYSTMQLSMEENRARIQSAYMAPAIQGSWQVEKGYIPCRIFKNISYGAFGITNSKTVYELFNKKIVYNPDCYQLFYDAKQKLENFDTNELLELMDFVKEKHTYIHRIRDLLWFFESVYESKQD